MTDNIDTRTELDEAVRDAVMAICCPKGRFYPNKDYGSMLCAGDEINRVLACARYAVRGIDGVIIKSAELDNDEIKIFIAVNDEERMVNIKL